MRFRQAASDPSCSRENKYKQNEKAPFPEKPKKAASGEVTLYQMSARFRSTISLKSKFTVKPSGGGTRSVFLLRIKFKLPGLFREHVNDTEPCRGGIAVFVHERDSVRSRLQGPEKRFPFFLQAEKLLVDEPVGPALSAFAGQSDLLLRRVGSHIKGCVRLGHGYVDAFLSGDLRILRIDV